MDSTSYVTLKTLSRRRDYVLDPLLTRRISGTLVLSCLEVIDTWASFSKAPRVDSSLILDSRNQVLSLRN